jgi:hypothetical protein
MLFQLHSGDVMAHLNLRSEYPSAAHFRESAQRKQSQQNGRTESCCELPIHHKHLLRMDCRRAPWEHRGLIRSPKCARRICLAHGLHAAFPLLLFVQFAAAQLRIR